jgi:hypothetical protein
VSNTKLPEVIKQPIEIRNPQNQNDDHQAIQDRFDLSLHWNEPVHKPQQEACCDYCDDDGGKRHIVFSNHFPVSIHTQGMILRLRALALNCPSVSCADSMAQLHRCVARIPNGRKTSSLPWNYHFKTIGEGLSNNAHVEGLRRLYAPKS